MSIICFFTGCNEELISTNSYKIELPDTNSTPPTPQKDVIFVEELAELHTIDKIKIEFFQCKRCKKERERTVPYGPKKVYVSNWIRIPTKGRRVILPPSSD